MKIAILAPPYLSVPPQGYGGTEMIVSMLTEGLVKRGHDVTLFASGDSKTSAKLVSVFPKALGNDGTKKGDALSPLIHYLKCFREQDGFDLIHSHAQYLGLFFAEFARVPVVHTWHGSFYPGEAPEEKRAVLAQFPKQPIISISDNQRGGMDGLNYVSTVYNGIDLSQYPYKEKSEGKYLLWLGRIVEKKGPLIAIQVAKKLNIPLKLVAAIDPVDRPYFEQAIQPEIDNKLITFMGEIPRGSEAELYGNALATLYPISWHEPFGLVMAESMACGTPVVAFDIGSVAEIVKDGETGFVVPSAAGMEGIAKAVASVGSIKRADCRKRVEEYFTSDVMVTGYEAAYHSLLSKI